MKKTRILHCILVFSMASLMFGCRSVEEADDPVTLATVKVTPTTSSLGVGQSVQLSAAKLYTDSTTQDCSSEATWNSTDTDVAAFSQETRGLLTAVGAGEATIQATCSGITKSFTLTVPALASIAVTPADSTLPIGLTQQLTATGTYADGSSGEITESVSWSSADTSSVIVGDSGESKGLARGLATGTIQITASLGSVSGNTQITVSAVTLESIEVLPVNASVPAGTRHDLTATGVFSDQSVLDLTDSVDWTSGDESLMTLSRSSGSDSVQGYAKAAGSVTVTARYGSVSGATTFSITAMTLQSIGLSPSEATLAVNAKLALTAAGVYQSAGSYLTADWTDYADWSTSDSTKASVSSVNAGVITALAAGNATITAADTGSGTSGSATVTVGSAELSAIEVYPARLTMDLNTSQRFTAIGIYSDNRMLNLTDQVNWTSSDDETLSVRTEGKDRGKATALKAGTVYLSVTLAGSTKGASAMITCTDLTLSSLEITPQNPTLLVPVDFKAVGVFSDNSSQDLTDTVLWSSGDKTVLRISNEVESRGTATPVSSGSTTVAAAFDSVTASTPVTVTSASVSSIQLTPVDSRLADGFQRQMAVTAKLSDNTSVDLTDQATYVVTGNAAAVSNAAGSKGLATGLSSGSSTVSAYYGSTGSTTTLEVTSATLSSLEVSPAGAGCIEGKSIQYQATGLFSDSTSQDLTDQVVWKSSDILTAAAVNAPAARGRVDCYRSGTATITAAIGDVSGTADLRVLTSGLNPAEGVVAEAE